MTAAGLAKISAEVLAQESPARPQAVAVPQFFIEGLRANKRAWENFNKLAPSYRRQYVEWVMSAQREETRRKRLKEAKERLSMNKKPGMK
jgi:uncharacterized protein YdeI (YjbR/CyaY-like superfamily)